MAGVDIESISICVGGLSLESKITDSMLILNDKSITSEDVEKLVDLAKAKHVENNKKILHCIPVEYTLDDYKGIVDPINMVGSKLEAKINIISSKQEPLNNIIRAVEMAGFYIDNIIASNVANGYSALIEDEKLLGTCLIDIGGFSTDISIYYNGKLILIDSVNIGSYHITSDLAHGLSVSLEDAERIKSLDGIAIAAMAESGKSIEYVKVGDSKDNVNFVSHSYIASIIQPRTEEIFEHVKNKIGPYQHIFNNRIVLTGGGSNLKGIKDLAQAALNSSIRLAHVNKIEGTTTISSNPRFITVTGGLLYLAEKLNKKPDYAFKDSKFDKLMAKIKKSIFK
jgi:cell division protein FtsA